MTQDSPATVAGTESRTDALRSAFIRGLDKCREIFQSIGEWPSLPGRVELASDEFPDDGDTPDSWAPVNRRTMRDDVDRFRNERVDMPKDAADAARLLMLSLEYYEHAHEVITRTSIAAAELDAETDELRDRCVRAIMHERDPLEDQNQPEYFKFTGGRYSKSVTGAEKLCDLSPAMMTHLEERRRLAAKKAEAEKEISVARRRHATLIVLAHGFTGSRVQLNDTPIADVRAGDTDRATLTD